MWTYEPAPPGTMYTKKNGTQAQVGAFLCSCDHRSANRGDMERHIIHQHYAVKYPCPKCNHMFPNAYYLAAHENIHTGAKPYSCKKGCEKVYSDSSAAARCCKESKTKAKTTTKKSKGTRLTSVAADPSVSAVETPKSLLFREEGNTTALLSSATSFGNVHVAPCAAVTTAAPSISLPEIDWEQFMQGLPQQPVIQDGTFQMGSNAAFTGVGSMASLPEADWEQGLQTLLQPPFVSDDTFQNGFSAADTVAAAPGLEDPSFGMQDQFPAPTNVNMADGLLPMAPWVTEPLGDNVLQSGQAGEMTERPSGQNWQPNASDPFADPYYSSATYAAIDLQRPMLGDEAQLPFDGQYNNMAGDMLTSLPVSSALPMETNPALLHYGAPAMPINGHLNNTAGDFLAGPSVSSSAMPMTIDPALLQLGAPAQMPIQGHNFSTGYTTQDNFLPPVPSQAEFAVPVVSGSGGGDEGLPSFGVSMEGEGEEYPLWENTEESSGDGLDQPTTFSSSFFMLDD